MPIVYFFWAWASALRVRTANNKKSFFMGSSNRLPADSLKEDRNDDDGPRQHEATRLAHGVDGEDLLEISNGDGPDQREQHSAAPAGQTGSAHHHHGDCGELVGAARLGIALLLLHCLANAGHGAEQAAHR